MTFPFGKAVLREKPGPGSKRGFALVVTVSLLILLTLLAVALLSLANLSLRETSRRAAKSEAEANARLALLLALGELQATMGPDARISARAATLAKHKKLGATVPPASARAWWVGAASSDAELPVGASGQPVVWLVSGLDPSTPPAAQVAAAQPFRKPVPMLGHRSIDTAALTGGETINAGAVMVRKDNGQVTGSYAYFIDDNGMKAQLAASSPKARNDLAATQGGGVIPGTYNLGVLHGMKALDGTPLEDYARIHSINDLPLLGGDIQISREKRMGYTARSLGVLVDVRKGRLKRDLTIAFEKDTVFSNAFPKGSNGFGKDYLVMTPEKYDQCPDLRNNGYIHWEMFKDYYNTKKAILTSGGGQYLDTILISKAGIFNDTSSPFARGQLGPHSIGPNGNVPGQHQQMPYGDYVVLSPPSKTDDYKHSPVIPILSRMQQNAWVNLRRSGGGQVLRTNVQLWTSQYNPYNIGLNVVGDAPQYGPRLIHYPQVYFTINGVTVRKSNGSVGPFTNISGFSGKRQTSVPHSVLLGPGRSHVCAFKDYGAIGQDDDEFLFDDKVKNLVLESIYSDSQLQSGLSGSVTLDVDFIFERPSMMQGSNSNAKNGNHEVAQTMWAPFAWQAINGRPGKKISKKGITTAELNENSMASFAFNLRTTNEGSGALRPLVDANIRALFCNTKWDSALGVDLLAAYSPENEGEMSEQIFQMYTRDAPKGYTYWGGGNDAGDGHDRVILFDIPREDLISLGQLQHAGVGRFSYEPTYIVGNSYANPRIPLKDWKTSARDTYSTSARGLQGYAIPGTFDLYDASYLVNEVLWDSYVFTTIPQVADNFGGAGNDPSPTPAYFESLLKGEAVLPNPRFIPYQPAGSSFDMATLQKTGSGQKGSFSHNAGHLLVDGAFNVNSTSVDAWEAFLSGTHDLPYQKLNNNGKVVGFTRADKDGVRFPRVKSVLGGAMETKSPDENYWTGFRALEQEEVRELAEAIVEEVIKRGPFLSLGGFVNRKLEGGELGERGTLQAALDATINKDPISGFDAAANHPKLPPNSNQAAGFPGQLLQGDLLQALSPCMTVRSDSFRIRAYGESLEPGTGKVRARAWCEASVQRYPDPVAPDPGSGFLDELTQPTSPYGRKFRMTSFRWLNADEI